MSLNDLFSDAPPAKQTTTSTTDPFADAPDVPKAPPKFSGAITGQGTKPSAPISGTAPFQLSPQDLAGLMPGGASAMPGIAAAETLVIVRDRVRSNARKRFGNRYSESHYELMGDYAATTGASNRAVMNLAAKGDFDTMRKALNTQPEAMFSWARGQMERVAQEATGQSLGSVLGDAAEGGPSIDLVSAALDPNSYSRQVAESIPSVPPAPVKRPDVLAAIKWQEENMRRDPATGMIAYTPRAMTQIRQKQRSDWMKRYGYDPNKEPIRYLSDLATETGEDLKTLAGRIVGPVDDFLTHGLRGEPTGRPMTVPKGAPWKQGPGPLAESIGSFLALPYDVTADTAILVHPKARMLDRAGAAVNLYLKAGAPGTARALNNIRQGGPWKIAEIQRVFLKDGFSKPEAREAARAVNGIYDFFMRNSETPPGFWDGLKRVTQERKLNIARNMSDWLQNRGTTVTPEPVVPALSRPVTGSTDPGLSPAPPTAPVAPPTTIQPTSLLVSAEGYPFVEVRVSPTTLGVYPGLQYKRVGITDSENAVTDDLKSVERYDQATAGPLTVWMTNDARLWVMNGHHRRELAIRTKEPDVAVRIFRESDGVDFQMARALGALQNIRDGKGTALDAATVLRDLGASAEKLRSYGLNTRGGIARDANSLLKLSDESLFLVEDGQVPEIVAASIADAGLDSKRELAVMKLAAQGGIETRSQAAILAERARNAPLVDRSGGMGDLFGEFSEELALAEQAKIADAALRRLAQSQRALNAFTRAKAVGNTVVDEEAQNAAAAIQEFGRKVIATDPETARILETEAVRYAGNPTKKQLEQSIAAVVASAERAAERRLVELGATEGSGLGPSDEDGIRVGDGTPDTIVGKSLAGPQEPGPLFDVTPELILTPEPPASSASPNPKPPDTNPVGPQLTLSPEEIGDTKGQFGLSLDRRMRGRKRSRRRYLAQKNLEGTGLPDKPREAYTRDEFRTRIDQISKIARGGGSNVFEDLQRPNALGVFEFPTRKFRLGRIRYRNGLPSSILAETLAHEVGHQIDFIVSNAVAGAKKPTGKISTLFNARGLAAETISGELIKVTTILEGEKAVADDPEYFLDPRELYARFLQSVMFHPHIVDEHAPVAFQAFVKMAEKHPIIADYLNIAKGGVIERPQAFFFFPDVRQGYIRKLDRYLGTKAYGEEVLYRSRRAKAIQDAEDLINAKFRDISDSPENLFDAAEGVKTTVGGVPEFGTRIYRSIIVPDDADLDLILDGLTTDDAKIQKFADEVGVLIADGFKFVGVSKDGNAMFEKWRKTPGEAELAYNALSDAGKALIREYTADLAEATDIFNRNLAAETFKIEGDLEGYVHHFGFAGNSRNVWSKLFLKERTASQRKHRSEAKGFKKDLKLAVAKTLTELSIEKVWNEFVVRQVALVAEPLAPGEKYANKPGWTAIEGDLLHGLKLIGQDKTVLLKEDGTSFLLKRGKRYQIPNELYERYVKSGPFGEELSQSVKIMNAVNRYWQANILVDAGSAATNLISGGLQFTAKVLDDFYKDILYRDGKFDRTLANMAGFFHTMTPSGWKAAPDWAFGGNQSLLYHQFFGQRDSVNAVDRLYDKLLTPYQAIERFWKKVILNAEIRKPGGPESLNDAEFIKAVNDIIDLYAYDYQNIPLWLETMKRNPVGAGVKPFMTYPYKYAKMLSNMAGGAFDANLPTKDRIAKLLALGTILTAYALYKRGKEKEKTVGILGPDEPASYDEAKLKSVVNPRGRLFLGKDASGKEVFVRTAKYPFLNVYDTISALVEGDVREASEIVRDQVGTLGPVGKLALNNVFGYRGEFDTYKSVSTMNAETGVSFFPLNRPLKSFAEILDPKKRNLPKTPGQAFGQLIPTTNPDWRRRLAGDEATVRVPLRKDELDLIRAKQQDKAIALVTNRLGQEAGKTLREYLVSREGKRATGRVGGMRETIDLPVRQNTADEIFKGLGGVILKRVDREWYDRFKLRAIENARNRDKRAQG